MITFIDYYDQSRMKPQVRQQEILARMRAIQKEWKVEELAAAVRVSPITIRRDLDCLGRQGAVIRTFGGGLIDNRRKMAAYHERVANNFELKQAIGRAAAGEIRKGSTILINDGSTTFHLAGCMDKCGPVTVYTNSIVMIGELCAFPDIRLNILGGEYHSELFYLGGALLERVLETISADTAFIGADAVSADGGCYCQDEDLARTAQLMMKQARRRILLADHTKFDQKAPVRYARLDAFDLWITSKGLKFNVLNKTRKMTKIKEV